MKKLMRPLKFDEVIKKRHNELALSGLVFVPLVSSENERIMDRIKRLKRIATRLRDSQRPIREIGKALSYDESVVHAILAYRADLIPDCEVTNIETLTKTN